MTSGIPSFRAQKMHCINYKNGLLVSIKMLPKAHFYFKASLKALCYFKASPPKALCHFKHRWKTFSYFKTPLKAQISLEILRFCPLHCFYFHLEFLKFNPPRRYFIVFIASPGTCFKILISLLTTYRRSMYL